MLRRSLRIRRAPAFFHLEQCQPLQKTGRVQKGKNKISAKKYRHRPAFPTEQSLRCVSANVPTRPYERCPLPRKNDFHCAEHSKMSRAAVHAYHQACDPLNPLIQAFKSEGPQACKPPGANVVRDMIDIQTSTGVSVQNQARKWIDALETCITKRNATQETFFKYATGNETDSHAHWVGHMKKIQLSCLNFLRDLAQRKGMIHHSPGSNVKKELEAPPKPALFPTNPNMFTITPASPLVKAL